MYVGNGFQIMTSAKLMKLSFPQTTMQNWWDCHSLQPQCRYVTYHIGLWANGYRAGCIL